MNAQIYKRIYNSPHIERITLDNEISLELESDPPTFESRNGPSVPEYFINNPYRSDIIT
jgi:hypothetical protein